MPYFLRLIKYYYLFLTFLVVFAPLQYSLLRFLPALLFMWVTYFCFKSGVCTNKISGSICTKEFSYSSSRFIRKYFVLFTLFLIIFIPYYIQFYTGRTILTSVASFFISTGSDSNYGMYQQYFAENNLDQFSISKLPYIILNGLSKVIFWYFCIYFLAYSKKLEKKYLTCFFVIYLLFFLSGVSRGTSFENFELLVITIFCLLTGQKIQFNKDVFSKKQLIVIGSILVVGAFYFIFSKSLRSVDSTSSLLGPTSTLRFDRNSWVMDFFPFIGKLSLSFSGYFIFPLYFTSELLWKISLGSMDGLMATFIPFGGPLVFPDSLAYRTTLENIGIDCGACWNPDLTTWIYYLGIPLYFYIIYLLGVLASKQYIKSLQRLNIGNMLFLFLITYELISLPVGNFLVISSANKIALLVILYLVYSNRFSRFLQL